MLAYLKDILMKFTASFLSIIILSQGIIYAKQDVDITNCKYHEYEFYTAFFYASQLLNIEKPGNMPCCPVSNDFSENSESDSEEETEDEKVMDDLYGFYNMRTSLSGNNSFYLKSYKDFIKEISSPPPRLG